ncbi:PQQ-binding-like beta-propeller repeat protein [Streptomyces sp. NPDC050659]|uniref:outer membrane protein assembly factor BamB family protein n=1 Tax=Streptomyces sp. NPDC050659 TaxID=3157215 RepID=UPI003426984B
MLAALAAVLVPRLIGDGGRQPQGKRPSDGTSSSSPPAASSAPPNQSARTAPSGPGSDVRTAARAEGAREKKWTADVPGGDDERFLLGGWLHGGTAVRVDRLGARGYDAATGDELWTVKPPKGLRTCAASTGPSATSGGIGALTFGKDPDRQRGCTRVGAVDTGSGKLLWHKDIGESNGAGITLGMTGKALVASGERGTVALDRTTGEELWHYTDGVDNCAPFIRTVGPRTVVLLQTCFHADAGAASANTVRELDAGTGKVRWTYALPGNVTEPRVLTTEPVAVSLGRGGDGSKDALLVLDLKGRAHHEIPVKGPYGELDLVRSEERGRMLSEGDVVIAQTKGFGGEQAELVAIDTDSGEVRFHRPLPFGSMDLLSLGDGKVTGMADYTYPDEPVRIVRFDLAEGATDGDGTLPYVASVDGIGNVAVASGRQVVVFASSSKSPIGAVGFG